MNYRWGLFSVVLVKSINHKYKGESSIKRIFQVWIFPWISVQFWKWQWNQDTIQKSELKTYLEVRINFCIPSLSIWLETSVCQEEMWLLTKTKWFNTQTQGLDCYKGGLKYPPEIPVCNLLNKDKNRLFGAGKQQVSYF